MSAIVTPPTDRRLAKFEGGRIRVMKHGLRVLLSLLWLTAVATATADVIEANPDFTAGLAHYQAGNFRAAVSAFERAALLEPEDDRYALWLGKACGRMAQNAGPLAALKWAGRTRDALERAVELNPDNLDAVESLADYYAQAPGFLGGDPAKASALRARLAAASATQTVAGEVPAGP